MDIIKVKNTAYSKYEEVLLELNEPSLAQDPARLKKLMKEQDEQKTRKAAEAYEDDSDLIRDMLLEALDLIEEAVELVSHAEALLNGEDIEADCCFPCRIMEVYCDDEL